MRDTVFYILALGLLIVCFSQDQIEIWESVILLAIYALYVLFMMFNRQLEPKIKTFFQQVRYKICGPRSKNCSGVGEQLQNFDQQSKSQAEKWRLRSRDF